MALYKNVKTVSFIQGLNEAIDEKILVADIAKANNVIVNKVGNFETRKGFDKMTNRVYNSTTPFVSGDRLVSYGELMLLSRNDLYSYSDSLEKWVARASKVTFNTTTTSFIRSSGSIDKPRFAVSSVTNLLCIAYLESGKLYSTIYSKDESVRLSGKIEVSADAADCWVFYKEGVFMVFYATSTNDLKVLLIPENNVDNTSVVDLSSDANAVSHIRVLDFSDKWSVVFYINTTDELEVFYIDNKGTIGVLDDKVQEKTNTGIALDAFEVTSEVNVTYTYWVAYSSGADLSLEGLNQELNSVYSGTIHSDGSIGPFTVGVNGGIVYVPFTDIGIDNSLNAMRLSTLDGGVLTTAALIRGVSCCSNTFNGTKLLVMKDVELQKAIFVLDILTGKIEGQLEYLTAAGLHAGLYSVIDGVVLTSTVSKIRRQLQTYYYFKGVNLHTIEESGSLGVQVFGDLLVCSGSVNYMYDAVNFVELGFFGYPQEIVLVPSISDGLLNEGQYFYTAVYMWEDNKGNIHRSAPAPITLVELSAGQNTVTIAVPTLKQTLKENTLIEVYRSDVSGGASYKLITLVNDKTVDIVTHVDKVADNVLIGNEMVYTEGGILENARPQGSFCLTVHQDRLFTVPQANRKTVQYSHAAAEGYPPEFSDYLIIALPLKEDITAIHGLGDNLIVFTEHTVGVISGQGADPLGTNASYQFSYLSQQIGCTAPDSVVETDKGLYFFSKKGLYLLGRGGNMEFIGQKVQSSMGNVVTGQGAFTEQNVYFFSEDSSFVYNETLAVWSTASISASNSISHNSEMYIISNGEVWKSNGVYSDDGSFIKTSVKSGWITTSNFQRVYQAMVYGKKIGNHKAIIKVFYDYEEDHYDTLEFDSSTDVNWGSFSWGSNGFDGESEGGYCFLMRLSRQKCKAVAFEISAEGIANEPTGGFGVSGIDLVIGSKKGIRKVGESKNTRSTRV